METAKDTKQPAGFGPGKALRQARLDLRLSPEDVATQLHLASRQILALEEDDFNALPQSTYVRGYLRSYALLLGLSPEPILEAYARMHVAPKPAIGRERTGHDDHQQSQVRIATYVVGVLVLVLVLAWWQGANKDELSPPPSSTAASTAPALTYSPTPPPGAGAGATPPPAESTPPRSAAPQTPAAPSTDAPRAASAEAAKSETVRPVPKTTERIGHAAPVDPNEPRARLVLNAEQDSWADVRDAHDNRLLYQNIPAGRIVALEGVPPFKVFLGNVDGIVVYIDGKVYDARKYKRGATARFSLGAPVNAIPADNGAVPQATPAPANTPVSKPKPKPRSTAASPAPVPPATSPPSPAAMPAPEPTTSPETVTPAPETSNPPPAAPAQ